jgi:pSer/pThr/pTyr-binding forkhead associated (FHA) protein
MKSVPVIVIQLVHIFGPMKGEIQEFSEGPILIGRDPSCHLRFPADVTIISRKHARIIREGNQFRLTDTSSNGTFVNGKRVKEAYLRNGDVLEFAEGGPKVSFLSEIREGQPAAEAPAAAPPEEIQKGPEIQPVQEPPAQYIPSEKPEPVRQEVVEQKIEGPEHVSVEKVNMPLIIQYGPTLRSYRELPVTIGRSPKCDFVMDHAAIYDQHAQIFFTQNRYWIKDLTGQQPLRINGRPVSMQAPVNVNDEISMSAQGPVFRFLGEGRLAEVEEAVVSGPSPSREEKKTEPHVAGEEKPSGKLLSKFKRYIDKKLQ